MTTKAKREDPIRDPEGYSETTFLETLRGLPKRPPKPKTPADAARELLGRLDRAVNGAKGDDVGRTGAKAWKTFSFHSDPRAIRAVSEKDRTIEHLISTQTVDRDGEVLCSKGCETDLYLRNNPVVFWNHAERRAIGMDHELPIARALDVHVGDAEVSALTAFAGMKQAHPFAERVFLLYRDRFLNSWSVGFERKKTTREKLMSGQTGDTVLVWPIFEYSAVGLPSNPGAITQFMKSFDLPDGATEEDLGKALGTVPLSKFWEVAERILPDDDPAGTRGLLASKLGRNVFESVRVMPAPKPREAEDDFMERCMGSDVMNAEYPDQSQRAAVCRAQYEKGSTRGFPSGVDDRVTQLATVVHDDPVRWNRDLPAKLFDVTRERSQAVSKEIELAARYLDCEVKELTRREMTYQGTRMGAGLVALDEAVGAFEVEDARNFARGSGEEAPLGHDVIRLNSSTRRSFMLDGTRFMRSADGRLVVRVSPEWRGVAVTVYGKGGLLADEFCDRVQARAASLKFYKGESFSLSGEFLDATDETWDDVFLTEKNEKAVRRVVELVNADGAAMENRGVIMLGEPGTGKTLATRVMRNETRGGAKYSEDQARDDIGRWTDGGGSPGGSDAGAEPGAETGGGAALLRIAPGAAGAHAVRASKDRLLAGKHALGEIRTKRQAILRGSVDVGSSGQAYGLKWDRPALGEFFGRPVTVSTGAGYGGSTEAERAAERAKDFHDIASTHKNAGSVARAAREQLARFASKAGLASRFDAKGFAAEPATFIWVSARDFYRMGAFGGIEHAFETAKELAPTIVVFEDVDNWIGRGEIDLLKTTMDGVSRSKGIATVLTTNDPAHFPTALIDRPGRFHDVLKIDLPDAGQRARMLARWAPELSDEAAKAAVDGTDGYSGAHVRELARFAGILREQDGVESPDDAIAQALVKVREQRDLIGETHAAQGRYRPRSAVVDAVKAAPLALRYSDDQPRDESGRWTDGGGSSSSESPESTGAGSEGSRATARAARAWGWRRREANATGETMEHSDHPGELFLRNADGAWVHRSPGGVTQGDSARELATYLGALGVPRGAVAAGARGARVKAFGGFETCGYTAPAAGATSPPHVHDYELEVDDEGGFEGGCAKHVADHSHRITASSLARGETEPSDGHAHALMTSAAVMAVLVPPAPEPAAPSPDAVAFAARLFDAYNAQGPNPWRTFDGRDVPRWGALTDQVRGKWVAAAEAALKEGRVLRESNYSKLKQAHGMLAEVIESHDATRPKPSDDPKPADGPPPGKAIADAVAERLRFGTAPRPESEVWFDGGALARDIAERLAVHTSPGAAGR